MHQGWRKSSWLQRVSSSACPCNVLYPRNHGLRPFISSTFVYTFASSNSFIDLLAYLPHSCCQNNAGGDYSLPKYIKAAAGNDVNLLKLWEDYGVLGNFKVCFYESSSETI